MALTALSKGKPEMLVVPDAPALLDEEDYPFIPYWQEEDWMTHCECQKDCGKVTPKLSFPTDHDRKSLNYATTKKFMLHATPATPSSPTTMPGSSNADSSTTLPTPTDGPPL
jgi:hypothetical protein